MYADGRINWLHLELTSLCQAACPMCARNIRGGIDNPDLPLTQLSLDDIKAIFPNLNGSLATLTHILLCGNYGDPLMVNSLLPIMEYIRSLNSNMSFCINTNGSARSIDFWKQLGRFMKLPLDRVAFGIDGLADTHHLYRRNTDFHTIIRNAEAFIEAGGKAHWEYLVFKHNEHQIEEARALAKQLGFAHFQIKYTTRFEGSTEYRVDNKDGSHAYSLYRATLPKRPKSTPSNTIQCKMWKDHSIYISAEGLVFPCCWMGVLYGNRPKEIWELIDEHGKNAINAKLRPIEDILNGPLFQAISDRWDTSPLPICKTMCSG